VELFANLPSLEKGRPNGLAVAIRKKFGLIADFDARCFQGGDGKLSVPFVGGFFGAIAAEDDAFHRLGGAGLLRAKLVVVALIQRTLRIVSIGAKPSIHIRPR
jgi:hypothetical protein